MVDGGLAAAAAAGRHCGDTCLQNIQIKIEFGLYFVLHKSNINTFVCA